MIGSYLAERKWVLVSLAVVTPAGFLFKAYSGPGQTWFRYYGAGALYEIFWCLVIFSVWPRKSNALRIALGVFVVTCVLEVLQLSHAWILERIRSTYLGNALIGTTFVWWDFPHYVLGCLIGWVWMRAISPWQGVDRGPVVAGLSDLEFGVWAEDCACKYLKEKGLRILGRNFATPAGEVDIIVSDKEFVIFVEVKAERGLAGEPELKLTAEKRRRLVSAAKAYIAARNLHDAPARFDLVTVQAGEGRDVVIDHQEDVFQVR